MTEAIPERALAMWKAFSETARNVPLRENPAQDHFAEAHEVKVVCECGKQYRLFVNSDSLLPELTFENAPVYCSCCERHCSEYRSLAGHSAGVFNVSTVKLDIRPESWLNDEIPV